MPRVGGCFKMTSNDSTKLGSFFENPALKKKFSINTGACSQSGHEKSSENC